MPSRVVIQLSNLECTLACVLASLQVLDALFVATYYSCKNSEEALSVLRRGSQFRRSSEAIPLTPSPLASSFSFLIRSAPWPVCSPLFKYWRSSLAAASKPQPHLLFVWAPQPLLVALARLRRSLAPHVIYQVQVTTAVQISPHSLYKQ